LFSFIYETCLDLVVGLFANPFPLNAAELLPLKKNW
jgi:hypothetical protein